MTEQLARQLALLEEYSLKAFGEHDEKYLPEVATKLRVLLVRTAKNKPLLLEVAKQLNFEPMVTLDGPPVVPPPGEPGPGDTISLDAFFDRLAIVITTTSGPVTLSKRQLIRAWCEQLGGAHEDWSVDESLVNAIQAPIRIFGVQPTVIELRNCAKTALHHGNKLIELSKKAAERSDSPPAS
jgi:hypothetical protein